LALPPVANGKFSNARPQRHHSQLPRARFALTLKSYTLEGPALSFALLADERHATKPGIKREAARRSQLSSYHGPKPPVRAMRLQAYNFFLNKSLPRSQKAYQR
jgi:hypothetical protein